MWVDCRGEDLPIGTHCEVLGEVAGGVEDTLDVVCRGRGRRKVGHGRNSGAVVGDFRSNSERAERHEGGGEEEEVHNGGNLLEVVIR